MNVPWEDREGARAGRPSVTQRAFVDESFRGDGQGAGVYLVAAVTVRADAEEDLREHLRRAVPGRVRRLHWRDDRPAVRRRGLAVMRGGELAGLTLYRMDVPRGRQERARQHALWNLVAHLRARDVDDVILEARERGQNRKDERTLKSISQASVSAADFRYAFSRPLDEPLLWLPDYLAGAYGEAVRAGGDRSYLATLPDGLVEGVELPPVPS